MDGTQQRDTMTAGIDCTPGCPVQRAAEILSGKWTTLIFRELLAGTRRYSELQYALLGISPKVLAQRLHLLEDHGLLTRKVYPTVPPRTEYTLTPAGRAVEPVIRAMAAFGDSLPATRSVA